MYSTIKPIDLFKFGSADTLLLRSNSDDLATSATFFWQLGRMVTPDPILAVVSDNPDLAHPAQTFDPYFVGADSVIGNATIDGPAYQSWDGSNAQALALVALQIPVVPV